MEEGFRNILVPIDGSIQSKTSEKMAVFISKFFKSQVTLLHVVSNELTTIGQTYSPRESYAPVGTSAGQFPRTLKLPKTRENVFPEEIIREVTESYRENGQAMLAESSSMFSKEGLTVKRKIAEGTNIAENIISEAESGNYDLVIMGNSGDEENENDLHLGSVAKKVSLSVKTSILIVRKKDEVNKILVPVNGSAKEEKALLKANMIAKATGSKIFLLNVQEKSLMKLKTEIYKISSQIVNRAAEKFQGILVEQRISFGDPANAIIKIAEQTDANLIIMSSGEESTLKKFFLGSVTDHVLHHATIPVLIVK